MARLNVWELHQMGYMTGDRTGRGGAESRRGRYEDEYEDEYELPL